MSKVMYYLISEGRKPLDIVEKQLDTLLDNLDIHSRLNDDSSEENELHKKWGGNYTREVYEVDGKNYVVASLSGLISENKFYGDGYYGELFERDFTDVVTFVTDAATITAISAEPGLQSYILEILKRHQMSIGGRLFDENLHPIDVSDAVRADFLSQALTSEFDAFALKMTAKYGLEQGQLEAAIKKSGVVDLAMTPIRGPSHHTSSPAPRPRNPIMPVRRLVSPPQR